MTLVDILLSVMPVCNQCGDTLQSDDSVRKGLRERCWDCIANPNDADTGSDDADPETVEEYNESKRMMLSMKGGKWR